MLTVLGFAEGTRVGRILEGQGETGWGGGGGGSPLGYPFTVHPGGRQVSVRRRKDPQLVHSLPKRVRPKGPTAFHFSCTAIKGSQTQSRRLVYSCAVTERRMYLQLWSHRGMSVYSCAVTEGRVFTAVQSGRKGVVYSCAVTEGRGCLQLCSHLGKGCLQLCSHLGKGCLQLCSHLGKGCLQMCSHRGKGLFTAVQSPRERVVLQLCSHLGKGLFYSCAVTERRVWLQLCSHREKGMFTAVQGLFTVV